MLDLDEDEKGMLNEMTSEMMTDEESGEDGSLIQRRIPWRSEELNSLISKLDAVPSGNNSVSKQRIIGEFSIRRPSVHVEEKYFLPEEYIYN